MNRVAQLAGDIHAYCAAHASASGAERYRRYFKEGYDAWGLLGSDHPFWNEQQRAWLETYEDLGVAGWLQLGERLFATGKYEEGQIAIRFLAAHRAALTAEALDGIGKWFAAGLGNWAHTDALCGELIAPLLREGRIKLVALTPWRKAPFKYQRRAVPVSMLGLLDTPHPVQPMLDFVRPLMVDSERVVHQGVGWFLRETWKKQPKPVEAFLLEWKDSAARLIYQYATEKMTPAAREQFRRAKAAPKTMAAARARSSARPTRG